MRVLVIGGTRYLGSAIVQRLAARGDEVTVANRGQTAGELPLGVAQVTCDIYHGSRTYLRPLISFFDIRFDITTPADT